MRLELFLWLSALRVAHSQLTGATVGVALAYLLPALCWFKVRLTLEGARACSKDNIAAVLVATLGVVMAVISLVISILNLASSVH